MGDRSLTKTCLACGMLFTIPLCRDWREHCCSSDCKKRHRMNLAEKDRNQRERRCLRCGQSFHPRWAQIRSGGGKYCSAKCQHIALVEAAHTDEANKRRIKSLERARREGRWMPSPKGEANPNYKGRYIANGYVVLNKGGHRIFEHRYVMEQKLGRPLSSKEIVHHKNHNKQDNRPENLEILTRAVHIDEHRNELINATRRHAKISHNDAREIRRRVAQGEQRKHVAKEYGIHVMTVGQIVRGTRHPEKGEAA